jgi:hypothetical protein
MSVESMSGNYDMFSMINEIGYPDVSGLGKLL